MLLALSLLWLTLLVQTYLGLTSDIKAARIRATPIANIAHMMSVDLTLYDQNGHQTSEQTYIVNGDEWMLQSDVIKFPTWLNIVGLHSGYKLTRLEGRYDDPNLESNSKHVVVQLNGGDDNFFQTVQERLGPRPLCKLLTAVAHFYGPTARPTIFSFHKPACMPHRKSERLVLSLDNYLSRLNSVCKACTVFFHAADVISMSTK